MDVLRRINISELWGMLVEHVKQRTEVNVYPIPTYDMKTPCIGVEFLGSEPANSKTEFVEAFSFSFHAISAPVEPYSPAQVLALTEELQEIMTEPIDLRPPFHLYSYEFEGIRTIKEDEETSEGHSVLDYTFLVSYGYICK